MITATKIWKVENAHMWTVKRLGVAPHSIQVASSAFEVAVEALVDIENAFDVLHGETGFLVQSQSLRSTDNILDLQIRLAFNP